MLRLNFLQKVWKTKVPLKKTTALCDIIARRK